MTKIEKAIRTVLRTIHHRILGTIYPLGHYYSPLTSRHEMLKRERQILKSPGKDIANIDLNERGQVELLHQLQTYFADIPFGNDPKSNVRYYGNNINYSYSDAVFLYSLIRHFKPQKIVEVGSGFSSAVMLDTNELFMSNLIRCTFIDPEPQRLNSLIRGTDKSRHRIIPGCVQDVDLATFETLERNDILFIDSSHVAKTGSDVNFIYFEIFPRLKSGVLIHIHDIFYPFEYPMRWILEGRSWNEIYLLRAFLNHNSAYKIIFMNTFLKLYYKDWFRKNLPLFLEDKSGGCLWLQKT